MASLRLCMGLGSLFYLRLILLCVFPAAVHCIGSAARDWQTDAPIPLVRPGVPGENDLIEWSELPACAHKSCYIIFQAAACPEDGLTRECFCQNKIGLLDHCLPGCNAKAIEEVRIWEIEQCLYSDSESELLSEDHILSKRSAEEPGPKSNNTVTDAVATGNVKKGGKGVQGQASGAAISRIAPAAIILHLLVYVCSYG